MKEKALHILFTSYLKKRLRYVPVDFKNMIISGIFYFNSPVGEHFNYRKRTSPFRAKFPQKEMKSGVIQEHFLPRREVFSIDLTNMKNFSSL